jgi:hypothetical protein
MKLRELPGRAKPSALTDLAGRKFAESHGSEALAILEERALLAEELGHALAARTWRALAAAARQALCRQDGLPQDGGEGLPLAAPGVIGGASRVQQAGRRRAP